MAEGKMKVCVLTGKQKLEWVEREIPQPGPGELQIKLEYVGVCGSDLHFYQEGRLANWELDGPLALGHEPGGVVTGIGEGVTGFEIGDKVSIEPAVPCGECEDCRKGHYNLCKHIKMLAIPHERDGVNAEYCVHNAAFCYKLPDNMDTMEGALLEPLSVGFHATELSDAKVGERAIVLGSGCIGLCTIMSLKARGVSEIYVADVLDKRLEKAIGKLSLDNKFVHTLLDEQGAPIPVPSAPEDKWHLIGHMIHRVQQITHKHASLTEKLQAWATHPVSGLFIALAVLVLSFIVIRFVGETLINWLDPLYENYYFPFLEKVFAFCQNTPLYDFLVGDGGEQYFGVLSDGLHIALVDVMPYVLASALGGFVGRLIAPYRFARLRSHPHYVGTRVQGAGCHGSACVGNAPRAHYCFGPVTHFGPLYFANGYDFIYIGPIRDKIPGVGVWCVGHQWFGGGNFTQ